MGYRTEATIPRSWYLTKALALEGKLEIPTVVFSDVDSIIDMPSETFINQFRVRLDPKASYGKNQMLAIKITDADGPTSGLHVRSTVAEFVPNVATYVQQPNLELSLPKQVWVQYFVGELDLDEMLDSSNVVTNNKNDVREFFSLFDQLNESRTHFVSPSQS